MKGSTITPLHTRPVTFLPLVENGVEVALNIHYRDRDFEVTFVVDEDNLQPDEVCDLVLSRKEKAAFKRGGVCFFHHLCVAALDADGVPLQLSDLDTDEWDHGLLNLRNHNDLIYSLCDNICDELDACDFPRSFGGFFVDWAGEARKFEALGDEYSCMVDSNCKFVDVFDKAGECVFKAEFYPTMEAIAALNGKPRIDAINRFANGELKLHDLQSGDDEGLNLRLKTDPKLLSELGEMAELLVRFMCAYQRPQQNATDAA